MILSILLALILLLVLFSFKLKRHFAAAVVLLEEDLA